MQSLTKDDREFIYEIMDKVVVSGEDAKQKVLNVMRKMRLWTTQLEDETPKEEEKKTPA